MGWSTRAGCTECTECTDCHIPLVEPDPPEASEEIVYMQPVKVASAGSDVEAGMIEAFLNDEGIQVLRRPLESGGYMDIVMGFSIYGEDIYVDKSDRERAEALQS